MYAEGPRFKSPVCSQELRAGIVFLGGGGGWSKKVIKEIYHKILENFKFTKNRTFHGNFPMGKF
jgi:hypothetical protein